MANSGMNHKPLFFDKLKEFSAKNPEYSLGEMFYSVLKNIPDCEIPIEQRKYLLELEDKQLYTGVDKAIKSESA